MMTTSIESARMTLLEEESQLSKRCVAVSDITMEMDGCHFGDDVIGISTEGLERICRQIKAPYGYVSQLEPDIRANLLQHHFQRGDLDTDTIGLLIRDQKLVAIEEPSLYRLSGVNVLDAVAESVGHVGLSVASLQSSHESFCMDLVTESHHTEVSPGDIIRAGLRVRHSFVGDEATGIEAYLIRLRCSNGMTYRDCISRGTARTRRLPAIRPDAHTLQMEQIRRLSADVVKSLQTKLESLKTLNHEPIEAEHLMRAWVERARLSTRELWPLLLAAWQEEGGRPTAYDAMNALTRVATHGSNLTLRTRRALASLAGILAFRQFHFCPRCFSVLNSSAG